MIFAVFAWLWLMVCADLLWENNTADWWLVAGADLVWENSTTGWLVPNSELLTFWYRASCVRVTMHRGCSIFYFGKRSYFQWQKSACRFQSLESYHLSQQERAGTCKIYRNRTAARCSGKKILWLSHFEMDAVMQMPGSGDGCPVAGKKGVHSDPFQQNFRVLRKVMYMQIRWEASVLVSYSVLCTTYNLEAASKKQVNL